MKPYKTVLFDLDGTLLDTSEGIINGVTHTALTLGLPALSIDRMYSFIGPPVMDSFMREFGIPKELAKEAVRIYRERYKEKGLFEAKKYDGINILLKKLKEKGIATGVATLKRDDFAKNILKHFALDEYFSCIRGIDENDHNTKAEIIRTCLRGMDSASDQGVLYIGDSVYDAEGAREAHVDFIGVTYGFGFKDAKELYAYKPVAVFKTVFEVIAYFAQLSHRGC